MRRDRIAAHRTGAAAGAGGTAAGGIVAERAAAATHAAAGAGGARPSAGGCAGGCPDAIARSRRRARARAPGGEQRPTCMGRFATDADRDGNADVQQLSGHHLHRDPGTALLRRDRRQQLDAGGDAAVCLEPAQLPRLPRARERAPAGRRLPADADTAAPRAAAVRRRDLLLWSEPAGAGAGRARPGTRDPRARGGGAGALRSGADPPLRAVRSSRMRFPRASSRPCSIGAISRSSWRPRRSRRRRSAARSASCWSGRCRNGPRSRRRGRTRRSRRA